MMALVKKQLHIALSLGIIAATVAAFVLYVHSHPETLHRLTAVPPKWGVLLLVLYALWFLAIAAVTRFSLQLFHKNIPRQENILFNAYSSLVNFFGPGQSGPIFRGIYLKKRHNLSVKQYLFGTLIYYAFYAVLSACMLVVCTRPWWQTSLAVAAASTASLMIIRWYRRRKLTGETSGLHLPAISWIGAATVVQMVVQTAIYAVELHASGSHASFGQVVSYTGAANFALFAALTPGAIGIREAFLVFSQHLHHIGNASIVAANVIDRAIYLVFLGLLAILTLSLHAKDKLQVRGMSMKGNKEAS